MVEVEFDLSIPSERAMLRKMEALGLVQVGSPVEPPAKGVMCVYIFAVIRVGPVKIGISDNAGRRLRSLRAASGRRLRCFGATVVASRDQARAVEREVHKQFRTSRLPGEWFRISVSSAVWAVEEAAVIAKRTYPPSPVPG